MPINVQCPGCGGRFRADDKLAGRRGKCPKCSALIEVKSDQQPPAQHRAAEETSTPPALAEPKKANPLTGETVPKTGSHRRCFECGKKRKIFAYNYAEFQVKRHGQIEPLVLPGVKQRDFLCVDCANKRQVVCKKHGEVEGRIEYGAAPACQECSKESEARRAAMEKEAELRRTAMEWQYWGEPQMLPCPFCGKTMERERVQMVFGGGGGGDIMSALMGMAAAYDTSKGGKHIEQKCENCGTTFESRLAPDADALQHGRSFHQWRPGPAHAPSPANSHSAVSGSDWSIIVRCSKCGKGNPWNATVCMQCGGSLE